MATSGGGVSVYLRGAGGNLDIASFDPATGWFGPALLGDGPVTSIPTGSQLSSSSGSVDVFWGGPGGSLWQASVW